MKITIKRAAAFVVTLSMVLSVVSPLNLSAYEFHLPTPEVTVPDLILDEEGEPILAQQPLPNPEWDPEDPESDPIVWVYLPVVDFPDVDWSDLDEDGFPVLPPEWEWVYDYFIDEDGNEIRFLTAMHFRSEVIHPDWPELPPGGLILPGPGGPVVRSSRGGPSLLPPRGPAVPLTGRFNVITTGNAGEVAIPARVGATGIASMLIPADAIGQALTAARLANLAPVVRVTPDTGAGNAEGVVALLNSNALSSLVSANATLQISNDVFTLELAPATLSELTARTNGGLRINITPQTSLHVAPRAALGDNPVFSFNVSGMATGTVGELANEMTFSVAAEGAGLFVAHIVGTQVNEIPSVFANGVFTWNASHGGIFGIGSR
ncbi:MAG: hypothetical protein FWG65_01710 [Turicibacter sp.]|nr:hypothetical protein [Turicibacter sp.]